MIFPAQNYPRTLMRLLDSRGPRVRRGWCPPWGRQGCSPPAAPSEASGARFAMRGLAAWASASHRGACSAALGARLQRPPAGRRWMSAEGAESEEDQHEIMFYSLRHAATVTLKEMHHFGAQVRPLRLSSAHCAPPPARHRVPGARPGAQPPVLTRHLRPRQTTGARCCSRRNSCTKSCP